MFCLTLPIAKARCFTADFVTIVQMYLAGIKELSDAQLIVADVNNDNKVGIDDATTTQKYLAKIIVVLL